MSAWPVGRSWIAYFRVAQTLIKTGRLEAVRDDDDLRTTLTKRLRFSGAQQRFSQPSTPMTFIDPKVRDRTASAPRVAADAGYRFPRGIIDAPTQ